MKFTEYGKKDGDTVILLHGAGLSWWNYKKEAELLADRFHVILPILDGHEDSDRPFTSIKSAAEEIIGFIDTCCGGSVLAIGGLSEVYLSVVRFFLRLQPEEIKYPDSFSLKVHWQSPCVLQLHSSHLLFPSVIPS